MFRTDLRHINTDSDSEVLLNVLAHELEKRRGQAAPRAADASSPRWPACTGGCSGAYAVVAMIAGYGVLAFRDPLRHPPGGDRLQRDRRRASSTWSPPRSWRSTRSASACCATSRPGEAVFIDEERQASTASSARRTRSLNPCIFEYVYLARPDSLIDGASVYESAPATWARELAREDHAR